MLHSSRRFGGLLCLFLLLLLHPAAGFSQNFSPAAEKYFDDALALMRKTAVNRRQVDWPRLEQDLKARAFRVTTLPETYPLIRLALQALDDHHSSLVPPAERDSVLRRATTPPPVLPIPPTAVAPPQGIAYLRLPAFRGTEEQAREYVARLRASLERQDTPTLRGWLVDLRGNGGGNMWPMLAALGPLLGDGVRGYFADADRRFTAWGYRRGQAFLGRQKYPLLAPAYRLKSGHAGVAVLTDARTASSGEALAVAFRGQPGVRSFGQPTYGVPSANSTTILADGALLNITAAYFADRTRRVYHAALVPDEEVLPALTLSRAVEWLQSRPADR